MLSWIHSATIWYYQSTSIHFLCNLRAQKHWTKSSHKRVNQAGFPAECVLSTTDINNRAFRSKCSIEIQEAGTIMEGRLSEIQEEHAGSPVFPACNVYVGETTLSYHFSKMGALQWSRGHAQGKKEGQTLFRSSCGKFHSQIRIPHTWEKRNLLDLRSAHYKAVASCISFLLWNEIWKIQLSSFSRRYQSLSLFCVLKCTCLFRAKIHRSVVHSQLSYLLAGCQVVIRPHSSSAHFMFFSTIWMMKMMILLRMVWLATCAAFYLENCIGSGLSKESLYCYSMETYGQNDPRLSFFLRNSYIGITCRASPNSTGKDMLLFLSKYICIYIYIWTLQILLT